VSKSVNIPTIPKQKGTRKAGGTGSRNRFSSPRSARAGEPTATTRQRQQKRSGTSPSESYIPIISITSISTSCQKALPIGLQPLSRDEIKIQNHSRMLQSSLGWRAAHEILVFIDNKKKIVGHRTWKRRLLNLEDESSETEDTSEGAAGKGSSLAGTGGGHGRSRLGGGGLGGGSGGGAVAVGPLVNHCHSRVPDWDSPGIADD
jgi:hypothetical protein